MLFCCFVSSLSFSQNKSFEEIASALRENSFDYNQKWEFTAFLNKVHPIQFFLRMNKEQELIGQLVYGEGEYREMLEGFIYNGKLRLESIDPQDEFTGIWTAEQMADRWINWVWINRDGSKGFKLHLEDIRDQPIVYSYVGRKDMIAVQHTIDQSEEKINICTEDGLSKTVLLQVIPVDDCKASSSEEEGIKWIFCGARSGRKMLKWKEQKSRLKKTGELEFYCNREMDPQILTDLCVPKMDKGNFNETLKVLLQRNFYQVGCDEQLINRDLRWDHIRKISTTVHFHDKNLLSFRLRLINTCTNIDTLMYFNFDKKSEKWITQEDLRSKIQHAPSSIELPEDSNVLIGLRGVEIHESYEWISGSKPYFLSYKKLGVKDGNYFIK